MTERAAAGARSRRALLAAAGAAAAAAALSGCGAGLASLAALAPRRLRVALIGLPGPVATALGHALQQCAAAYAAQTHAPTTLALQVDTIPSMGWYACAPKCNLALPGTGAVGTPAQIAGPSGAPLVVAGRTALDVLFGADPVSPSTPAADEGALPDVILAFDTWQYWLAPLAEPVPHAWQEYDAYHAGVDDGVAAHGQFYGGPAGTVFAGFPLLRAPMGLFVGAQAGNHLSHAPQAGWTWSDWLGALTAEPAPVDTSPFRPSLAFPQPTEAAAAVVAAEGGRLGRASARQVVPLFQGAEAGRGVALWAKIVQARHIPYGSDLRRTLYVQPAYAWTTLSINRAAWTRVQSFFPLPGGTAGRRVPSPYLCAFVVRGARAPEAAAEFCASLWSRSAQAVLGATSVGLELRRDDAAVRIAEQYPWMAFGELAADPSTDLSLPALYGGWKTPLNAAGYDAVSDGFAGLLNTAQGP